MLTILLISVLALVEADAAVTVELKSQVHVTNEFVYLSDVITDKSFRAAQKAGVSNIKIMPTPPGNRGTVVNKPMLRQELSRRHKGIAFSLEGPPAAVVRRKTREISAAEAEEAVRRWVEANQPEMGTLYVDQLRIPPLRNIPSGQVEFRVQSRSHNPPVGHVNLYVDIIINGDHYRSVVAQVRTSLETMVPVATRQLQRGTILSQDAYSWENRRLDRLYQRPLGPDQVEGVRASTVVRPGDMLTTRNVEAIPLVERNQPVMVIAQNGVMQIRMKGVALQQGAKGDLVRIKNPDSNRVFAARVTNYGEARLDVQADRFQ